MTLLKTSSRFEFVPIHGMSPAPSVGFGQVSVFIGCYSIVESMAGTDKPDADAEQMLKVQQETLRLLRHLSIDTSGRSSI